MLPLKLSPISAAKDRLLGTWANFRGLRTKHRVVVFESDDWGSIRMPDRRTYDELLRLGISVDHSSYDRLDCLENRGDLNALFTVLQKYKNAFDRPPTFTFNTIMGNPDFAAIRKNAFSQFVHEDLFRSYRHYHGDDLRSVWNEAIAQSLIRPQFHGREHLNVELWLSDLRSGFSEVLLAFDKQYFGLPTRTSTRLQKNYLAACWPASIDHYRSIKCSVVEGLSMFDKEFGYRSQSFVPCNYILPKELESATSDRGVQLIQGQRGQLQPSTDGRHVSKKRCHTGQQNSYGQYYSVRNVKFEPFEDASADWTDLALNGISSAFYWGTPAIIGSHRINYVGGMDLKHRDRSLRLLDNLIRRILIKWPDVQFATSDELIPMMAT